MIKIVFRIIFILLITLLVSSVGFNTDDQFITTLYMVVCIIFSVLFSLSISFNLDKITNKNFLNKCRNIIYYAQKKFIIHFIIATIIKCLEHYSFSFSYKKIFFNSNSLYVVIMLYICFYFIFNFKTLQEMKDNIIDKILDESRR